ncbi:MAG: hypothetical protein JKY45_04545 [Emcibacter sp.]|nr:hypothetical protein [Emcibacter sp.]
MSNKAWPYYFITALPLLLIPLTNAVSEEFYHNVSMTQLIATPERYKDKKIRVVGYYAKDIDMLYLSKDHAEINDYKSSIYISGPSLGKNVLRDSSCVGQYIEVTGIFQQTKNWDFYAIHDVINALAVKKDELCWEKTPKE